MRRSMLLAIALLALASLVAGARPALAQSGAIAYDQNNCAWGDSWNAANQALANAAALGACKYGSCQVLAQIGPNQCGALAATPNCKGWGWATRPNRADSELGAMQECQKYNAGQCTVRVSDCNR
jgi:hypothetical protein